MADNKNESTNRGLTPIHNEAEEETLTLGGPTAKEIGTEYQFVSEVGRETAGQLGPNQNENAEQRADAGRDPEYYFERQTPDLSEGEPTG